MSEIKPTSIKKNFVLSNFYQVLNILVPFITAPYISRVLGKENIGIFSFTGSIEYFFALFAALGTVGYGTREIARVRDDKAKRSKIFWEIECLSIVTTLICTVLWLGLVSFSSGNKLFYLILSINLIAVAFDISWVYAGLEHFEHMVLQNSIFKLLGLVAIFSVVKTSDDLPIYMVIMGLTILLGNISMWIYLPKYISKVEIRDLQIKPHISQTLVFFVPTIASSIYTVLDKALIGIITNDNSQNGIYEQATKIINIAKIVCFVSINNVISPRASYLFAAHKYEEVKERINQTIGYITFIGVAIMFGLLAISSRLVPVYFGNGYEDVVLLLYIFSPITVIIGISNCIGSLYYSPAGLRAQSAKYLIYGSIINLVLNLTLIPMFMSYGAAVSSVIAEIIVTILYMNNCSKYFSYLKLWLHMWKKLLAGLVMFIVVFAISNLISNSFVALVLGIIIGAGVYTISLVLMKDSSIALGISLIRKNREDL